MRILSLDGGGYLGLATAAFLEAVEHHFQRRCADQFDMFCGTSTGAIIALALAKGMSATEIVALYQDMGPKIFRAPPTSLVGRAAEFARYCLRAKHQQNPLRIALDEAFQDATLADVSARGKAVMVAAFNLTSGLPRIFKTNHTERLSQHGRYRLADLALASAAAPTYFPVVELRTATAGVQERFCDGGVFANSPALLGYAEALGEFKNDPRDVEVLSISTPRLDLAQREHSSSCDRGLLAWRKVIADVMTDGTSHVADGALARIARAVNSRYVRIVLENRDRWAFDVVTPDVTQGLLSVGNTCASNGDTREQLQPFFLPPRSAHG